MKKVKIKKSKPCCKKPNYYYQGDYEYCLNCKYKKEAPWVKDAVTSINGKWVY